MKFGENILKTLETEKNINRIWLAAPITFAIAGLLPEYIAPVLMVVCFIIFLKDRIARKQSLSLGAVGTPIVIFMGWMVVASFYANSVISSLASIGLWLLMLLGYLLVSGSLDTEEKIKKTIYCGGLSAGAAGAIGIAQMIIYHFDSPFFKTLGKLFNPFWHFLDVEIPKILFLLPDFITSNMQRTKFLTFPTRACSTFSNPLFFSAFEVMMLPFAAYMFLCARERKWRIIGFICFMLSLGGIASSYSRGPYLAAFGVLVILMFYGGKKSLKLGITGAGIGAALMVVARGTIKRILSLGSTKDISLNTRKQIFEAAFETGFKRPIFGYGTGFDTVRQILHNDYNIKQPHAHNIALEIWLENGLVGVVLFALILLTFVINIHRLAKCGKKEREYALTLFASVCGFIACGMTDCLFYGLKPLQYMMLILGISQALFAVFLGKDGQLILVPAFIKNLFIRAKEKIKNR